MMLTDFIIKSPTGEPSSVTQDHEFRKVFNALTDKTETVAKFLVPSWEIMINDILLNKKINTIKSTIKYI